MTRRETTLAGLALLFFFVAGLAIGMQFARACLNLISNIEPVTRDAGALDRDGPVSLRT